MFFFFLYTPIETSPFLPSQLTNTNLHLNRMSSRLTSLWNQTEAMSPPILNLRTSNPPYARSYRTLVFPCILKFYGIGQEFQRFWLKLEKSSHASHLDAESGQCLACPIRLPVPTPHSIFLVYKRRTHLPWVLSSVMHMLLPTWQTPEGYFGFFLLKVHF